MMTPPGSPDRPSSPAHASAAATAASPEAGLRKRTTVDPATSSSSDSDAESTTHASTTAQPTAAALPLNGVTANGVVFAMPKTSDMLSSVFGNLRPASTLTSAAQAGGNPPVSNVFDHLTLGVLGLQILAYFTLPIPRACYLVLFLVWRLAYNFGLGVLLDKQSKENWLLQLVQKHGWFDAQRNPTAHAFFKREFERKMGYGYKLDAMPVEFNTWLLFRSIVDMILINDFATYCIFFVAYWQFDYSLSLTDLLRVAGGLLIVVFNLWVKVDAHRVVKDFAWYWGDFFFLLNNPSLTFDGVFEMAPHPMYSVGYAGYYGVSLITGSYTVLFVSLLAHAGQLAFLTLVENPHIFKTYGKDRHLPHHILSNPQYVRVFRNYFSRDLVGLVRNVDPFRAPDLFTLVIGLYALVAGLFGTPEFAVAQSLFWILFHTGVLGAVLHFQSTSKAWTRHFIKYGATNKEAFEHWKAIYNLSMAMLYVTFVVAACKWYSIPSDWTVGTVMLRHTLGGLLILLHIWTSLAVFEVLGDFGYFFGDFFIDRTELPTQLFYTGIYRFVNNPEKIMGHAAFWGIALASGSWTLFALALVSHIGNFLFLTLVEEPHMTRLYGAGVRKESGVVKLVKTRVAPVVAKVVPPPVVAAAKERVVVPAVGPVAASIPNSIESITSKLSELVTVQVRLASGKVVESTTAAKLPREAVSVYKVTPVRSVVEFGDKIEVEFAAPKGHVGRRDWIGLYRVAGPAAAAEDAGESSTSATSSTLAASAKPTAVLSVTPLSSNGHWKYLNDSQHPPTAPLTSTSGSASTVKGTVTFHDTSLVWTPGYYEARLHYDESHTVVAVSSPFLVTIPTSISTSSPSTQHLAQLLRTSFGTSIPIPDALKTDDQLHVLDLGHECLSDHVVARRFLTAIRAAYGVDFHRAALAQFGSLDILAERIADAQRTLGTRGGAVSAASTRAPSPAVGAVEADEREAADGLASPPMVRKVE
ncbi:phospholipid methyltransferase-domain-containing protein [Catenaria anguillulae PL171]|uniref:Phosphatidylethanolamine N-methyltransferase n=1 Tax=Catenaria anguillulae PL171 TaxID=765915 RepID=A0A1Y2HIT4_9FUNG|nr:phospholipid methyltransferase-domain-containing protein [Catenaria anguillulae PL171]